MLFKQTTIEERTQMLKELSVLLVDEFVESYHIGSFSEEDDEPTLHLNMWRHYDIGDLNWAFAQLLVAAEGHWEGGRCYSLQFNK